MSLSKLILLCKECGHQIGWTALKCPNCGSDKTTKMRLILGGVILLAIFVLFMKVSSSSKEDTLIKNMTIKYAIENLIFGTPLSPDFTIKNLNNVPIKNITIKCDELTSNGSKIESSKNTIPDVIQPQESKVFKDIYMGNIEVRTASINCTIISVETP